MSAHRYSNSDSTRVSCNRYLPAIFYSSAVEYVYDSIPAVDPKGQNAYLPLEVDTEFFHPRLDFDKVYPTQPSPTITMQCRAIALDQGEIFTHLDSAVYARHPLAGFDFVVVDYLQRLGYNVTLERDNRGLAGLPWIQIDLYAFFAVAELLRVFRHEFREDVMQLTLNAEEKGRGIVQGRRLRTFTKLRGEYLPWVAMPWVMNINGNEYAVRLAWYDTSAVHGQTGYAGFCSNTGTPIPFKDAFTSAEKADMLRMYQERPEDFDNYALGDLYNHKALTNNIEFFQAIYKSIGLEKYFSIPRLTTGATVRDLMEGVIGKLFHQIHPGNKLRNIVNAYCRNGTASDLKKRVTTTAAYNAKVDGGRCRNNRPTDTVVKGVICDLDIAGCYGEGLRVQLYPLGNPVVLDYPIDSPQNVYMTLRQFIKRYGKELVAGAWQARVSTKEGYRLKYPQDFLMSWFPPKDISKLPTDTDLGETEEWWSVDNVGLTKIFTRQVNLALINHDFIQWLDNIASSRQRKELLDNLLVVTALYYPLSDRVDSVRQLRDKHDKFLGQNTCTIKKVKGQTTKISVSQECHAWYGVTLGDMFITKLLQERRKYPKKTPLNELFKLCINTTFGDMVSPYFAVGNVVVGNNITARARSLAWYMEKGLHGWQTITDGCAFDVNAVLHPAKVRVNGESVVELHRGQPFAKQDLALKPLGLYDSVKLNLDEDGKPGITINSGKSQVVSDSEPALDWVNKIAMEHLQSLFPKVDVLHAPATDIHGNKRIGQFSFEAKGIYECGVFHGSGNYQFYLGDKAIVTKMRSYSKRPQEIVSNNCLTVSDESFYPATTFLSSLLDNCHAVVRQPVFLKPSILKIGDFSRHHANRYDGSKVFPGMTIKTASLLREYSLSQFTYQDFDQYRGWEQESNRLRKRYGQSYEMYFLNTDGTLNYQLMLRTLDDKVAAGMNGFWDGLDKRSAHGYRCQSNHPALETLDETRLKLAEYYGYRQAYESDDEFVSDVDTVYDDGSI